MFGPASGFRPRDVCPCTSQNTFPDKAGLMAPPIKVELFMAHVVAPISEFKTPTRKS